LAVLSVAAALAAWEGVVAAGILDPLVASSPSLIAAALPDVVGNEQFVEHVVTSGLEFVIGFGLGAVLGILLGLVFGWYRRLRFAVEPAATAAYVTPRLALLPAIVLWFGFGMPSTTILVFLSTLFIVLLTVMAAIASVDESLVRAARSFTAGDRRVFQSIVLPSSVPSIVTALRLGVGRALSAVIVAEVFGAAAGIGYYIHVTASTVQIDRMFVAVGFVALAGLASNVLFSRLEARYANWRPAIH
jgi:NitT/TauT family transport system permease protein